MDKIIIESIILTPLKKIAHPKGDILHGMKNNDNGYAGFGEAYFSTIKQGEIKGWNRHKAMTLNLIVPTGKVTFVIYDDREKSKTKGSFYKVDLSSSNYKRLTVPPKLWLSFKGGYVNKNNLILNISNMAHDPGEIEHKALDQINYNWESN